jgi:hypothetical protein
VACAVEDADGTGEFTVWAAGTVSNVDYDVENDATELGLKWNWAGGAGVMPYRVLLDTCDGGSAPAPAQQKQSHSSFSRPRPRSRHVFVHRDVHWLLRGLDLQPAGPRQSPDGSRAGRPLITHLFARLHAQPQVEPCFVLMVSEKTDDSRLTRGVSGAPARGISNGCSSAGATSRSGS